MKCMSFKCIARSVLSVSLVLPAMAMAQEWTSTPAGISYWCAGVGGASQDELKSAESSADARVVLTSGPERAYLSDVNLTVSGANKQQTASWQAKGPICLLKLPAGAFTVDARYGDESRSGKVPARAKGGAIQPLIINFKPS